MDYSENDTGTTFPDGLTMAGEGSTWNLTLFLSPKCTQMYQRLKYKKVKP